MTSIKSKQKFQVDTRVEAKVSGWKQMYKGKVTGYNDETNTYSVEFEDGDKQNGIKSFNIRAITETTFTSPDGKKFESKSEYKKYMNEVYYALKDLKDQKISKKPGDIQGQGFSISNIASSEIVLMDHSDQVLIDNVTESKILIGPSSESVFVRNARNCHFFIACKQFRCRDCQDCKVSLYSKTEPVVETSSRMSFYPYNAWYAGQTQHFKAAKLEPTHNHWCNVFDFNKGDSSIPEPHWLLVPKEEGWDKWELEGEGTLENPVPEDACAEVVPKEGSYGIETLRAPPASKPIETINVESLKSELPETPDVQPQIPVVTHSSATQPDTATTDQAGPPVAPPVESSTTEPAA